MTNRIPKNATEICEESRYVRSYVEYGRKRKVFLAPEFAADLVAKLGAQWIINPDNEFNDYRTLIVNPAESIKIMVSSQEYGVNSCTKIDFAGWYYHKTGKHTGSIQIKTAITKDLSRIVKDIESRLLPQIRVSAEKIKRDETGKSDLDATLTKKATALLGKYPDLKIRYSERYMCILIETKIGSKIELDGQIILANDVYRLSTRGGFRIADIDSAIGRATLALINKGV